MFWALRSRITPLSDLGNSGIYLECFKAAIGFAIFRHAKRHLHAGAAGGKSRSNSFKVCCAIFGSEPILSIISASSAGGFSAGLGCAGSRFTYICWRRETYLIPGLLSVRAVLSSIFGRWRGDPTSAAVGMRLCEFFGRRRLEESIAIVVDGREQLPLLFRRRGAPFLWKMKLLLGCPPTIN